MPLLANAYVWTARKGYTGSTKVTGGAASYLNQVLAHIEPNTAGAYIALPDAAFKADYYVVVDSGTDIATGDYLVAMTMLDGLTAWPGDVPPSTTSGQPGADITIWSVVYMRESAPGFLPARECWIARLTIKGPSHQ